MAKLPECQFIEITENGNKIEGTSTEKNYDKWVEGYSPLSLSIVSGSDGPYFNSVQLSFLFSDGIKTLYENYLKQGHKDLTITIVHRGSDKNGNNYDILKVTYADCRIGLMKYEQRDSLLFMSIIIDCKGTVELTTNVPNAKTDALDKIGPIKYDIAQKTIL